VGSRARSSLESAGVDQLPDEWRRVLTPACIVGVRKSLSRAGGPGEVITSSRRSARPRPGRCSCRSGAGRGPASS
jgi:hypothetical protein